MHAQTVLGQVEPEQLGVTLPHEHLLVDVSTKTPTSAPTPSDPSLWEQPITLSNYYYMRRNIWDYREALQMVDVADAMEAASLFKNAGGGCIVDVTSWGIGRDPNGLRRIAEAVQVHIVMGCGYYVHDYHPPDLPDRSEEEISEEIAFEIAEGVNGSGPKPGIIGEIGLSWPPHPDEAKVLRAAARVQAQTGLALTIHPGRNPAAPLGAIRTVEDAGGIADRVVIGHLDRTLFDLHDYVDLAKTGCYLEIDLFGLESSYYTMSPIDMPNDAIRIKTLLALAEAGFAHKLLVSQDIDSKVRLRKYGGEGYEHLLVNVVPMMLEKGMERHDIESLMVENPKRLLTND